MLPVARFSLTRKEIGALLCSTVGLLGMLRSPQVFHASEIPGAKSRWEVTLAEDDGELEYKGAAASKKSGAFWIVVGRRPKFQMSGQQLLEIRAFDRSGHAFYKSSIPDLFLAARLPGEPDRFIDMAATEDGEIAFLLTSKGKLAIVVVSSENGHITRARVPETAGPTTNASKILSLPRNGFAVLGQKGGRAVAIKLDAKLDVLWERVAPNRAVASYIDGTVFNDGSFIAAGLSPGSNNSRASVWLGRISGDGETSKSILESGLLVSVVAVQDGTFAVVLGTPTPNGVGYSIRSYDQNFTLTSNLSLLSGEKDYLPFRVLGIPEQPSEFLVVGSQGRMPWLARVRTGSRALVLWTHKSDDAIHGFPELLWNFGAVAGADKQILLPSTVMVVDSKIQQRQTVRIDAMEL